MTIPRIFIPQKIELNQELILDEKLSNRLLRVLRLQPGNEFFIFNGKGGQFLATLLATQNKYAKIKILKFNAINNESPLNLHLGQGIARGEKMDLIIQKAVELGVSTITPLFTEFCNVKLSGERLANKLHHWQEIAIHAAEQSGRCVIPNINQPQLLSAWLPETSGLRIILSPEANKKISALTEKNTTITLLIGPEGGLSPSEEQNAIANNFQAVKLGPRILRTETAGLVALSIFQSLLGDL
jgi:16S rRNA (uracil1498-N3)-methyltransferase